MITEKITEFQQSILLSDEEKRNGFWLQDDNHLPNAKCPLFLSFMIPAFTYGFNTALQKAKLPLKRTVLKSCHGHAYQMMIPYEGDFEQRIKEHQEAMRPLFPRMKERLYEAVEQKLMPFYNQLDEDASRVLTHEEALKKLDELFSFYQKAWEIHFDIVMPQSAIGTMLEKMYEKLTGETNPAAVYELLVGIMNKSLETERELWKLSELAKKEPAVLRIFANSSPEELEDNLSKTEEGSVFLKHLDRFLSEYGYRKNEPHEFLGLTWIENRKRPLEIIQSYIEKNYNFQKEFDRISKERQEKYERLLERLPQSELKDNFIKTYEMALKGICIRDDHHFYIDAMLTAKSRLFLLNVGKLLVQSNAIQNSEDIFFLYLDEVQTLLKAPDDAVKLIEKRKAEYEENLKKKVPVTYGTPPEGFHENQLFERVLGRIEEKATATQTSFKGFAASKGTYTGTVKVVHHLDEFQKLKKGDVLVCKTTTPPWTVLFSSAGAVITDAGGILSHSGIIAREYKIPAVVGTRVATATLKDGDVVAVDGTNGVVTIVKQN
ncbi:PEP-utilizing enzyme [Fictibacillus sp. Mic-4]|uniref:PEP-utilizing enzyme n=1 Tax=Fictibacillus sp. Mic-4 TaxID=3132826 RepID=UPI003CF4CF40